MKLVVQRVTKANVALEDKTIGEIQKGFVILLGISNEDTKEKIEQMVRKVIALRIFEDENQKMNLSLKQVNGEILVISQFTLLADCKSGNRPSFTNAGNPILAEELYEYFIAKCKEELVKTEHGMFGADMKVSLTNDGPVTIILEN